MLFGLVFAILFAGISFGIIRGAVGAGCATANGLLGFFIGYFMMPTLAYGFTGILLTAVAVSGLIFAFSSMKDDDGSSTAIGGGLYVISFLVLILLPMFTSWGLYHDTKYRALLGTVTESKFSDDIAPIDPTSVRLVDQRQAAKLAETKLGEDSALGSRVSLGEFSIQSVNGNLYWVAPLKWRGFWKWAFGEKGTPGYMKVSATNQRDVKLIRKLGDKPISLKILSSGAYFGDDLNRVIYTNGYATQGYEDFSFEINDEGRPYWVVTKIDRKVGFDGSVATGVIVVDPQTREIKEYDIASTPKWIDRIQPETLINDRINDYGDFVHGWFNPEGLDKTMATKGLSLVYGNDGRAYWYTGIQTVGSDQGTLGFMLVDSRTGKAKMYRQPGITEEACQRNILGLIAEKRGWRVTECILYNVGGSPTYIAIIKDGDGNPKRVGLASALYRSVVVSHTDIRGALRSYTVSLRSSGGTANIDAALLKQFDIKGRVVRFSREILDGNTVYYMMVSSHPNKLLTASPGLSPELAVTQIGDRVYIKVNDLGLPVIDISTFDNLSLGVKADTDTTTRVNE